MKLRYVVREKYEIVRPKWWQRLTGIVGRWEKTIHKVLQYRDDLGRWHDVPCALDEKLKNEIELKALRSHP